MCGGCGLRVAGGCSAPSLCELCPWLIGLQRARKIKKNKNQILCGGWSIPHRRALWFHFSINYLRTRSIICTLVVMDETRATWALGSHTHHTQRNFPTSPCRLRRRTPPQHAGGPVGCCSIVGQHGGEISCVPVSAHHYHLSLTFPTMYHHPCLRRDTHVHTCTTYLNMSTHQVR